MKRPKPVSKAILKRVENCLGFSPGATISLGLRMMAQRAGERVREFRAENPTAAAMVSPSTAAL